MYITHICKAVCLGRSDMDQSETPRLPHVLKSFRCFFFSSAYKCASADGGCLGGGLMN